MSNGSRSRTIVTVLGVTNAYHNYCIGGISEDNTNLRLHRHGANKYWNPRNCPFKLGYKSIIEFEKEDIDPINPHQKENVIVYKYKILEKLNNDGIITIIEDSDQLVESDLPISAFMLKLEDNVFFRTKKGRWLVGVLNLSSMPKSIGFWKPTSDLHHHKDENIYTTSSDDIEYSIKYVGTEDAIEIIPAGTIVRLSMSGYFDRIEAAAMQLSGWFL